MRALERLGFVAIGFLLFWFAFYSDFGTPQGHVDKSIEAMKEPSYIVVGYNPDMKDLWRMDHGSRGAWRGPGSWTAVTFKTKEEADAARHRLCCPPSNDKGK